MAPEPLQVSQLEVLVMRIFLLVPKMASSNDTCNSVEMSRPRRCCGRACPASGKEIAEDVIQVAEVELAILEAPRKITEVKAFEAAALGTVKSSAKGGSASGGELVVFRALAVVGEHLVRLVHLLEFRFVAVLLVRVVFMSQLVKSLFYLVLAGGFRHA
ncbi:MAG: hypothetical protein WDN09_03300 [bacterium]